MSALSNYTKRFLHNHWHLVDFLSASLIICLSLIILLPKVHESFEKTVQPHQPPHNDDQQHNQHNHNHNHHHHHHHGMPVGEILICVGFFVFYCIGLGLSSKSESEMEPLLMTNTNNQQRDDDCLLLLNRHHNHHKQNHYGSTSKTTPINDHPNNGKAQTIIVEEIRISREPIDIDHSRLKWPLSARVTLFGLLFAFVLIVFDMNIHGLMEAIKVFRAAGTGALLYVAFFLVLPKNQAGCKSCT